MTKCLIGVGCLLCAMAVFSPANAAESGPLYAAAKAPFVELVREGKASAVVVLPEAAALEMRHAAKELTTCVRRMSGAELPVVSRAGDGPAIVLEVDAGLNPPPAGQRAWSGSRGYRLRADGRTLRVIGSDPLSVLYGVYGLLERHLGVRWLWPGELGEVVPEQKNVRVGQLDETSAPAFPVRWVGNGPWALRHGSNAMMQIGEHAVGVQWKWHFHTFSTLIPAEKYYDAHPDWWPLVKGKRQRPTAPHSHSTQLCTSNAEMVAELTRNLIAVLDEDPKIEIITLSPNDGGGFCECEKCRALDEPGRDWFARYSKRLAVLNNAVAREVQNRHPNVLIKVGAYAMYLRRPLEESLAPTGNQIVQICHIYCCHSHTITGNRCTAGKTFQPGKEFVPNQVFDETLRDWKKVASHLFVYEYYTLGGPAKAGLPWPLVHTMREDMPYYRKMGVESFYTQLDDKSFHRYGLNYYVAAKLAWDTTLNADAIMADYCRNAFGPACESMFAYFRRLEKAMVDADLCLSYGQKGPQHWGPRVFNDGAMREAANLLDRALADAPAGDFRRRVEFFKKGFDESQDSLAKMKSSTKR